MLIIPWHEYCTIPYYIKLFQFVCSCLASTIASMSIFYIFWYLFNIFGFHSKFPMRRRSGTVMSVIKEYTSIHETYWVFSSQPSTAISCKMALVKKRRFLWISFLLCVALLVIQNNKIENLKCHSKRLIKRVCRMARRVTPFQVLPLNNSANKPPCLSLERFLRKKLSWNDSRGNH